MTRYELVCSGDRGGIFCLTVFQLWIGKTFNNNLDLLDREDHPGTFVYTVCLTGSGFVFALGCVLFSLVRPN